MRRTLRAEVLSMLFAATALVSGCGAKARPGTEHRDGGNTGSGGATGDTPASGTGVDAAASSGGGGAFIDAPVATGGSANPGGSGGNGSTGGTTGGGGIAGGSGGSAGGVTGSSARVIDAGVQDGALLCGGVSPPDAGCAYRTPVWYCNPIDRGDVWVFTCPLPPTDAGGGSGGRGGSAGTSSGGAGTGGTAGIGGTGGSAGGTGGSGASTCAGSAPCQGAAICSGQSCGGSWTCVLSGRKCGDVVSYCGCDGVTFTSPDGCPNRPVAYLGTCETGANCSQAAMTCTTAGPVCPQGVVAEILNGCYSGRCVPIGSCGCTSANDCPDRGQYTCDQSLKRCTYYL
jgi:hypothetical protein